MSTCQLPKGDEATPDRQKASWEVHAHRWRMWQRMSHRPRWRRRPEFPRCRPRAVLAADPPTPSLRVPNQNLKWLNALLRWNGVEACDRASMAEEAGVQHDSCMAVLIDRCSSLAEHPEFGLVSESPVRRCMVQEAAQFIACQKPSAAIVGWLMPAASGKRQ